MSAPRIIYHYRGGVERGCTEHGKPSYRWHDGYSENSESGGILYPWMTARECHADARNRGAVAELQRAPNRIPAKTL